MAIIISEGVAEIITGLRESAATVIVEGLSEEKFIPEPAKSPSVQGKNVAAFPNALEQFASYTPLWTMAALEPEQFNNPASYRNSPANLKHIVFSSAGRYDSQRVQTQYGTPEYYVNNFIMRSVISASQKTGNSNAISFNFEIYEPYSMGLFLQSLQLAALNAKHVNYLQAPYVLKLEFLGSTDDGKFFTGIVPKYFTCKLSKVEFDSNESGSTYKIEAIPYNHQGFSNVNNTTFTDIAIQGDKNQKGLNVRHILVEGSESLCKVLNRQQFKLVENKKQEIADEYEIQFPVKTNELYNTPTSSANANRATINPNDVTADDIAGVSSSDTGFYGDNAIGNSSLGNDRNDGGNYPFARAEDSVGPNGTIKRNQMVIDPKNRKYQFPQGQSLTQIITQIILSSEYASKAITETPKDGLINWFKIDVQYQLKGFDKKRGAYAKKIIYRVLPYQVHISIFSNPTSAPPGYGELEKIIAKRYDYIYSGQNNDVLNFNIQIKNLFYTGTNPTLEKDSGTNANVAQKGLGEKTPDKTETTEGPAQESALAGNTGGRIALPDPDNASVYPSPSGSSNSKELVAKAFHNAFLKNSTDLINIDLEILGDPYWMVDSGIGNYLAEPSEENKLTTLDGTMNYEGSDVYIYVTFRTPIDVNENTGLYQFPDSGKESPFSGIYKVIQCESQFSDGTFKQKLKCIRMPLQAKDFDGVSQPIDKTNVAAVKIGEAEKPQTTVSDDAAKIPARLRR